MISNRSLLSVAVFVFLTLESCIFVTANVHGVDEEGPCKSRVRIYGYECEEHKVTTEDGYILTIVRIPNGRSSAPLQGGRIPVLLQHGVLMDGITWLLSQPDESLGFILADNGYDVWIANTRGTVYSQGHISLSPDDKAYWDWTWDELAAYDLPATFNYVYDHTGQQRMHYVGHSLGTLIGFAAFSEHNLLNMLRSAAMLCPIAYVNHMPPPLVRATVDSFLSSILYWLGISEFNPIGEPVRLLLKDLCSKPGVDCYNLMSAITGDNCCLNRTSVEVFLAHEPQPSSTKNMIHLAQMARKGTITKYDYGIEFENMKHYGQPTPPVYNFANIPDDLPMFLSYGGNDGLADVKDVKHLLDILKPHQRDRLSVKYIDDYAHADFVMAVNAHQLVYDPLLAFFSHQ